MNIDPNAFRSLAGLRLATPDLARGQRQGERRARAIGSGVEFAEHRPYQPGDDLRRVDWNAYQRQPGTLHLRLFSEDRNLRVLLVLDATGSMSIGAPFRSKLEQAGMLAGGLALLSLLHRDFVLVAALGSHEAVAPVRGHDISAWPSVLNALQKTEPGTQAPSLRASILSLAQGRSMDYAFLCSDMLVPDDEQEATLRALATVARAPILLHVVAPQDLQPDLSAPTTLVDAETGEQVDVPGGPEVARAWAQARDAWLGDLDRRCRRLGIRRFQVQSDTEPLTALRDGLRAAGVLQAGDRA